jgi:hypothetical protein
MLFVTKKSFSELHMLLDSKTFNAEQAGEQ